MGPGLNSRGDCPTYFFRRFPVVNDLVSVVGIQEPLDGMGGPESGPLSLDTPRWVVTTEVSTERRSIRKFLNKQ